MAESDQSFRTFSAWVDHASSWLTGMGPGMRAVCVDARGRRCRIGKDFMRARDEGAFPVRWFWPHQLAGANLDCMVSDALAVRDDPGRHGTEPYA